MLPPLARASSAALALWQCTSMQVQCNIFGQDGSKKHALHRLVACPLVVGARGRSACFDELAAGEVREYDLIQHLRAVLRPALENSRAARGALRGAHRKRAALRDAPRADAKRPRA